MANNPKNQDNIDENVQGAPTQQKESICQSVYGKVKWFNVKRGYGFVCRNDNQEDVFIHQSAIVKSNPEHPRKSVGEGEEIQFDIVKGVKGNEAANVCGADGNCVRGSEYALRYPRGGRGRYRGGRGGRGRGRSRGPSEEAEGRPQQEFVRGGPPRGGRSFRGGARPYMVQYRKAAQFPGYDMPPPPHFYYDYEYMPGPPRGRGEYRGPRVFRGGPPPPGRMAMHFSPYEYEGGGRGGFERRPPRGGRGRYRGGRGGRGFGGRGGRGGPRDAGRVTIKDEGEEPPREEHAEEHRHHD